MDRRWIIGGGLLVVLALAGLEVGRGGAACTARPVAMPELPVVTNGIPARVEARAEPGDLGAAVVPGRFVVKLTAAAAAAARVEEGRLRSTATLDAALDAAGVVAARQVLLHPVGAGVDRYWVVTSDRPAGEVLGRLNAEPEVEIALQSTRVTASATDPLLDWQWHLTSAPWATTRGDGVVVAVVDTGVSAEAGMTLLPGRDFVDDDTDASDPSGHGTMVAATIAASDRDGLGGAGVAPGAHILPVRVLDAVGGTDVEVANGIVWAAEHGARVINLSLGGPVYSALLDDAVDYAAGRGAVVVASAGNGGYTGAIDYPAACDAAVAVGAITRAGTVARYSNRGAGLAVAAPGGDVTGPSDGGFDGVIALARVDGAPAWAAAQGTSLAAAHVSGAAALLFAAGRERPVEVVRAITKGARDAGPPGWDDGFGHGVLDPAAALAWKAEDATQPVPRIKKAGGLWIRDARGGLRWQTTVPATTEVEGTNGFTYVDPTPSLRHRVFVAGEAGAQVTFTVRSVSADGVVLQDLVPIQFPPAEP